MTRLRFARLGTYVCAALLTVTGASHARLALMGTGDVPRHAVFVGLNLGLAALLVVKPRWALVPALLLSVQQGWSHGSDLVASTRGPGPLDVGSAAVLVFFPVLIALLVIERRESRAA